MFSFLRKRREEAEARERQAVLDTCEQELHRTAVANCRFMNAPRDIATRTDLLTKATAAGVSDRAVVRKLAFFDRMLTALRGTPDLATIEHLLTEADQLAIRDGDGILKLVALRESLMFAAHGLRAVERDPRGRAVYLRCAAEFKNKPGQLEVREDGVAFRGEVLVEIPWSNVVHAAETSHTYQGLDYAAVAIQEGKRRTPTKFAFPLYDHGAELACKIVVTAWQRRPSVTEPPF